MSTKTKEFLENFNGWERLWLIASFVAVTLAAIVAFQTRDYSGVELSPSCIPSSVVSPISKYDVQSATVVKKVPAGDFLNSENWQPLEIGPDGKLVGGRQDTQVVTLPPGPMNMFYCTTYGAVQNAIFFALLASFITFLAGHAVSWIRRGF